MAHPPPATLFSPSDHRTPPGTGTIGMWLFLAALAMLFLSSMLGYVIIRLTATERPPMGSVDLPWGLWVSTAIILASSYTIHRALTAVRRERQTSFRHSMVLTLLLAVGFLLVQTPSLLEIIRQHIPELEAYRTAREQALLEGRATTGLTMPLEGLVFFLILVHALHVVGGVIPLVYATVRAQQGRYDHEHHSTIKHLAMYWHFLDAVWIFMFVVLLIAA